MIIQLHDTYFVFAWYVWLPVIFAALLFIVLVRTPTAGLRKTSGPLLMTTLALLISLSVWVSAATVVSTTLLSDQSAGQSWLLTNLSSCVIAGQVVLAGFLIWLGARVRKTLYHPQGQ